jgi:hypothetical protein
MVFVLDGYYGGAPGTVGGALFSVAEPLLSLSSAALLVEGPGQGVQMTWCFAHYSAFGPQKSMAVALV